MRTRPSLYALWLAIAAALPVAPARAAEPVPIAAFFDAPALAAPRLSPSGRYLALRAGKPGRREYLVVFDLATDQSRSVAAFNDVDVAHFQWINDERLLFDVTDKRLPPSSAEYANGLFAVNRDGSHALQLAERTGATSDLATGSHLVGRKLLPWHTFMLQQRGAQDSEYAYVENVNFDALGRAQQVNLQRLNTLTGQASTVPAPASVRGWMLDQDGEPRLATSALRDVATLHYRDRASGAWRVLSSEPRFTPSGDAIEPAGFGPDGTLYVVARTGKDTSAIHRFDFTTGKVDPEPLVTTTGYDFNGALVTTRAKVLGLRFTTDAESQEWLDPDMQAIQRRIDKLLPGTINLLSVPARAEAPWVLVDAYADTIPHTYLVFNGETGALKKLGASYPAIDSARMGLQQQVRYQARDGLPIPALLTLPAGGPGRDLPLVVLVHGGPWVRGASWGWHPESQFLASRGYAVLEPSYRGSTGFGARHFMAGLKQWGLAMQDDVADGARWAIAQGIADPKRICIAGASYGGYATLMGLVNDPGLYQCGVDWAGVTDIKLMYTGTWNDDSDVSDEYKKYGMPALVGDPDKDAAQLKATSPIAQAARIGQPLLLAYGGKDRRVPLFHGKQFYDAVKGTNQNVEWIEYPDEGHGWALPETRIDFWSRVEKFLARNIGK